MVNKKVQFTKWKSRLKSAQIAILIRVSKGNAINVTIVTFKSAKSVFYKDKSQ